MTFEERHGEQVALIQKVIDLKESDIKEKFYGSWGLIVSHALTASLEMDYHAGSKSTGWMTPTMTLKERILKLEGVFFIAIAPGLKGDEMMLQRIGNIIGVKRPTITETWN